MVGLCKVFLKFIIKISKGKEKNQLTYYFHNCATLAVIEIRNKTRIWKDPTNTGRMKRMSNWIEISYYTEAINFKRNELITGLLKDPIKQN